jgi:hypothetical protein
MHLYQETKRYYSVKSAEWLACMDIPSYLIRLDAVLQQEDARCTAYLNPVTRVKLHRIVLEECMVARSDAIFDAARDMFYATYDNSQVT